MCGRSGHLCQDGAGFREMSREEVEHGVEHSRPHAASAARSPAPLQVIAEPPRLPADKCVDLDSPTHGPRANGAGSPAFVELSDTPGGTPTPQKAAPKSAGANQTSVLFFPESNARTVTLHVIYIYPFTVSMLFVRLVTVPTCNSSDSNTFQKSWELGDSELCNCRGKEPRAILAVSNLFSMGSPQLCKTTFQAVLHTPYHETMVCTVYKWYCISFNSVEW